MEYNEDEAIKYMRQHVGSDISKLYNDDELINLIDIIWEYYESNGLLDINLEDDEDTTVDFDKLIAYCKKMISRDKGAKLAQEHISPFVTAEVEYEKMIEDSFQF